MAQDDHEARIAEKIALIKQQEAARQKKDRPEPTLKPKHARGPTPRYQPKSQLEIEEKAEQLAQQEDREIQKKQIELGKPDIWSPERTDEVKKDFNKNADPEMSKHRKSAKEQMAERAARIEKNPRAKKNRAGMQQRDQQSRFFDKDRDL